MNKFYFNYFLMKINKSPNLKVMLSPQTKKEFCLENMITLTILPSISDV